MSVEKNIKYHYFDGQSNIYRKPHTILNRSLSCAVIVHVINGKYICKYNNDVYEVLPGQTLFVPEYTLHHIATSEGVTVSWAHIQARYCGYDIFKNVKRPFIIDGDDSFLLKNHIDTLVKLSDKTIVSIIEQTHHLSGIFLTISRYAKLKNVDAIFKYKWSTDLQKYISENTDKNLSVNDIAKMMSMSPSSLCHKFKEVFSVPLKEYIIQEKLNESYTMIAKGLSNKQIAEKLGFCDEYYFSKRFKKHTGITVTEYKKSIISNHSKPIY